MQAHTNQFPVPGPPPFIPRPDLVTVRSPSAQSGLFYARAPCLMFSHSTDLRLYSSELSVERSTLSREELQTFQENDRDLGPMMRWMKERSVLHGRLLLRIIGPLQCIGCNGTVYSRWKGYCSDDRRLHLWIGLSTSWCCLVTCNHRSCNNTPMTQQLVILVSPNFGPHKGQVLLGAVQ